MGNLSFSFTVKFDEDGEEIPTIKCPKCSNEDCKLINIETDLYKCDDCGNEFIPDLYKAMDSAAQYGGRGWSNYKLRRYKRTIKDCTAAIKLEPNNDQAYLIRGMAWGQKGNHEEKEKDESEAIRINPKNEVAYFNRGEARANLENYNGAVEDFDEAIKIDPGYKIAIDQRANVLVLKGDYSEAILGFSECIRLDVNDAESFFRRGYAHQMAGKLDAALEDYNKADELNPNDASTFWRRVEVYELRSNYKEALSNYKKFLKLVGKSTDQSEEILGKINKLKTELDPNDKIPYTYDDFVKKGNEDDQGNEDKERKEFEMVDTLARMGAGQTAGMNEDEWAKDQKLYVLIGSGDDLILQGKSNEAYAAYSKAINFKPDDPTAYVKRGSLSYLSGDMEAVINDLSNAIKVEQYHMDLCFLRGSILMMMNREDEALQDFLEAICAKLDNEFDGSILSKIHAENNQLGIAIQKIIKDIKIDTSKAHNALIKGILTLIASRDIFYEKKQDYEEPLESINRAISYEPNNAAYYWCRGFVQDSYNKKIKDYSQAINLKGDKGIYYYIRGYTQLLGSDLKEALQDFSKVNELEPKNTELYEKLGIYFFYKVKDIDQAIEVFTKATEYNPNNPNIYYYRGLAFEKKGINDSAVSDFQKYVDLYHNGGDFKVEKVKERIEIISKGGIPDSTNGSDYGDNSMDLGKLLAGLAGGLVRNTQDQDKDQKEEVEESGVEGKSEEEQKDAKVYQLRGMNNVVSGNPKAAIEDFTKAIQLDPKNYEYYKYRGMAKTANSQTKESIEDYNTAIQMNSNDPELFFIRAGSRTLDENLDGAIEDLLAAKRLGYTDPKATELGKKCFLQRAFKYIEEKQYDKAIDDLSEVIKLDNMNKDFYKLRGAFFGYKKDNRALISDFQMYVELEEDIQDKEETKGCIEQVEKAIDHTDLNSTFIGCFTEPKKLSLARKHLETGAQWQSNKQMKEALREYQIAKNIDPTNAQPYQFSTLIYLNNQDWDNAITNLTETIRIKPDDADSYLNRGVSFGKKGKLDEAINDFKTVILYKPEDAQAYQNLGAAYLLQQKYDLVIDILTKAITIDPKTPDVYLHRASAKEKKGERMAAIPDFQKYIDLGGSKEVSNLNSVKQHIQDLRNGQ